MVTVDIYVPVLDKTYDFKLDEDALIKVLIEEMVEMVGQKEQSKIEGNINTAMLVIPESRTILSRSTTLKEMGIHTGDKLILV